MKVIYIDTETTGLDWTQHQMIQLAMVADDLANPQKWEYLPKLNIHIKHNPIIGDPIALSMNHQKLADIASGCIPSIDDCADEPGNFVLCSRIIQWLEENKDYATEKRMAYEFNTVGKNAAGFDFNFLWEATKGGQGLGMYAKRNGVSISFVNPSSGVNYSLSSRVLDPGSMMTDLIADSGVPSLNECMRRFGIAEETKHDAMGDCYFCHLIMRKLAEIQREKASPNE